MSFLSGFITENLRQQNKACSAQKWRHLKYFSKRRGTKRESIIPAAQRMNRGLHRKGSQRPSFAVRPQHDCSLRGASDGATSAGSGLGGKKRKAFRAVSWFVHSSKRSVGSCISTSDIFFTFPCLEEVIAEQIRRETSGLDRPHPGRRPIPHRTQLPRRGICRLPQTYRTNAKRRNHMQKTTFGSFRKSVHIFWATEAQELQQLILGCIDEKIPSELTVRSTDG